MPAVLLLHASTHGHTSKIAARVAAVLEDAGLDVDVRKAAAPTRTTRARATTTP